VQPGARGAGGGEEAAVEQGRLDVAGPADECRAVIEVAAQLDARLRAVDHAGLGPGMAVQCLNPFLPASGMVWRPEAVQSACAMIAAADPVPLQQGFEQSEAPGGVAQQSRLALNRHGLARGALADIDTARNLAAGAGAGAEAQSLRIQHEHVLARLGEAQRAGSSGIARTDHQRADMRWQGNRRIGRRCEVPPPPGSVGEIVGEDAAVRHAPAPKSAKRAWSA